MTLTTSKPASATPSVHAASGPANTPEALATSDEAARVLRQFRLVFNTVKTHFRQMEKRAGIGGAQVWALSVIRDRPDLGIGELARALDVRQPTASNLAKSLTELGLIATRKAEHDGRAVALTLLPAGAAVLAKVPGPFTGVLPQALSSLDTETLARLEQDLAVLIQVLGADEQGANIPLSEM